MSERHENSSTSIAFAKGSIEFEAVRGGGAHRCTTRPLQGRDMRRQTVVLGRRAPLSESVTSSRGQDRSTDEITLSFDPRDDLKNIVVCVQHFAANVLGVRGVRWEITVPPDLEHIDVAPEECRRISMMFRETLKRIVEHTLCSAVVLSVSVTSERLLIEIRDSGCGLFGRSPGRSVAGGHSDDALRSMQARIVEAGGTLELAIAPTRATLVTLTVTFPQ